MGCESWTVECLWKIWCHDVKRVNWHAPTKFGPNIACGFQGALQWPTHRQLSKRLPNAITPWEKQPRISWKRPAATFWCNVTSDWSCEGFDGNEGKHVHHANSAKKEKKKSRQTAAKQFFYIQTHRKIWWHEITLFDDTLPSCFLLCSWWVVIIFCVSGFDKCMFSQRRSERLIVSFRQI